MIFSRRITTWTSVLRFRPNLPLRTSVRGNRWQAVQRRGYASGSSHGSKYSSDIVWAAAALVVTAPATAYLLQQTPQRIHGHHESHGDEDHDEQEQHEDAEEKEESDDSDNKGDKDKEDEDSESKDDGQSDESGSDSQDEKDAADDADDVTKEEREKGGRPATSNHPTDISKDPETAKSKGTVDPSGQ